MPKIAQYISRDAQQPAGPVRSGVAPVGIDLRGLVGGVADLVQAQQKASADLAADEARMRITNTMSDAQVLWAEKLDKAQRSAPKDAAGFTTSTLKDFDEWAKARAEAETHPEGRKLLENNLAQMRKGIHADSFRFEVGQRNRALVDDFSAGTDADRRAAIANPASAQEAIARRVAVAQSLNLPAETREKLAQHAREAIAFDAAQALVDTDAHGFLARAGVMTAGAAKGKDGVREPGAADKIASDPLLSLLAPEKLRATIDRASTIVAAKDAQAAAERDRLARQAEIEAARRERAAAQGWNILSGLVADGRTLDQTSPTVKAATAAMQGTPYAAAFRELLAQAPANQAAAMLPLEQQQFQLDALNNKRNTAGTSPELEKEIARREKVLAAARKDYETEPLRAAQERGVLPGVAALDASSIDAMAATIAGRVQQAGIVSQQVGRAVSPLLSTEAQQLQTMLAALPPDKKAEQVAKLSQAMGPDQVMALAAQVDARDKPLAYALAAGAARTTQGRLTSELILRGAQVVRDKSIKMEDGPEFGLRSMIAQQVGDAVPAVSRAGVIESAVLISYAKAAEGNRITPNDAVRLAIGGDLIEHAGRRLPVPVGMDTRALQSKLMQYPERAISAQAPDGFVYLPGGRPMGVPEFLAALPNATLEPYKFGQFTVRAGGSQVMNANRQAIIVDVR